jgi:hypothetical protein
MSRLLAPLIATTVILTSGLAQGVWTGRWSNSRELETCGARLERLPMLIGDWEGRATTLDKRTLEAAEISGYVMRSYRNRRDGRTVMVLLVCGRPGPIAVHTPEVCYAGSGYEPSAEATKRTVDLREASRPAEFWSLELTKPDLVLLDRLRIIYSWNAGGGWVAARNPRVEFAGAPALYKLYVVRQMSQEADWEKDDSATDFARELLPSLQQTVFHSP